MKKILIQSLALLTIFTFIAPVANAGLFDWKDTSSKEALNQISDSFDKFYSSIKYGVSKDTEENTSGISQAFVQENSSPTLTKNKIVRTETDRKTYKVSVSAYSSTPDQTDDSPFITAQGTYVRDGIVATNFLPFGTKIKIPDAFGDKIFTVEDRMNKRYWYNVDIWFPAREPAKEFGRKTLTIEVI